MVVFFGWRTGGNETQAARHAQMNEQVANAKIEQQVFAAALCLEQCASSELLRQPSGNRVTQSRRAQYGTLEAHPFDALDNATPGDFDFG